jgi:dTDP-glucose pyrophosphorylase
MTDPLSQSVWTRKRHIEEATRSWWLDAGTREAFTAAADREQSRILRSRIGTLTLGSNIIVGWNSSGRKP